MLEDFDIHVEAALSEVAQDFMSSTTTMGRSQMIPASTYAAKPTLDLGFSIGVDVGDLHVEELSVVLSSWSDYHLVGF